MLPTIALILVEGKLDQARYARVDLPNEVSTIAWCLDKDPPIVIYLRKPMPNPELSKVRAGWFERMSNNLADGGIWTWGVSFRGTSTKTRPWRK